MKAPNVRVQGTYGRVGQMHTITIYQVPTRCHGLYICVPF